VQIIADFQRENTQPFPRTDIDRLAEQYLHLSVCYTKLSNDGTLLGLTAYDATDVQVELENHWQEIIHLEQDTVLLERRFLRQYPKAAEKERLSQQRVFTLAHECGHQIIYRIACPETRKRLQNQYVPQQRYDCRDLKTKEDWNEWQANTLGAALLMPKVHIDRYFAQYQHGGPLISYGGRYATRERVALECLTSFFGVSRRMMEIRLKHLGYLETLPRWQYSDPSNIFYDDMDC
jgi:hypothetical protein